MSWKQACMAAAVVAGASITAAHVAPPAAAQQLVEGIAAIVNQDVITTYDVRQRAQLLIASSGIEPSAESLQRAQQQALRDLIDERLQLQAAAEFEIEVTEDQINAALAGIAEESGVAPSALEAQLRAAGIRPATLRDQLRADIAWRRLINGLYGSRVRVSDIEISATQARIAANAERAQYLVSEIFLPAETPQEQADAVSGAQRLLAEMQRGAPFPLVARQFSGSATAAGGGDMGWMAAGELPPELQQVVDQLQPGQVSLPITTRRGIYIIALRDRRAGQPGAAVDRVSLLQVTAPASSRAALERMRGQVTQCPGLASQADSVPGAAIIDLGFQSVAALPEDVRSQIDGVQAGRASPLAAAGSGVSTVVVCSRSAAAGVPSREEIERRLFDEELSMRAQRYLRDLRREASITAP